MIAAKPVTSRPKMRNDLQQTDLKDGCVLYDREKEMTYTLNITASLIWSYLDGNLSMEEIAEEIISLGSSDKNAIWQDILHTINFLEQNRLLERGSV